MLQNIGTADLHITASGVSGDPSWAFGGLSYGACSGWKPVYSNPQNGISPFDPAKAGGEAYDLADVGMTQAKYVRITDKQSSMCPSDPMKKTTNLGYDLDAIALINAQ